MLKIPINAIVRNRQEVFFKGQVLAVSSTNLKGPFDILAHHANFIAVIEKYVILHHLDGTTQQIKVDNGILMVESDLVHVYLETLTPS